jgi:hypothetical protein
MAEGAKFIKTLGAKYVKLGKGAAEDILRVVISMKVLSGPARFFAKGLS